MIYRYMSERWHQAAAAAYSEYTKLLEHVALSRQIMCLAMGPAGSKAVCMLPSAVEYPRERSWWTCQQHSIFRIPQYQTMKTRDWGTSRLGHGLQPQQAQRPSTSLPIQHPRWSQST